MFLYIVLVIAFISVALAIVALINQGKMEEVKKVKQELKRGRVIYHKDSSASSDES